MQMAGQHAKLQQFLVQSTTNVHVFRLEEACGTTSRYSQKGLTCTQVDSTTTSCLATPLLFGELGRLCDPLTKRLITPLCI